MQTLRVGEVTQKKLNGIIAHLLVDFTSALLTEHPNDRETFSAEKRAAKVYKQYLTAARDLVHQSHNSQRGEVGPIEAKLFEFCAFVGPKIHAAVDYVLGAFSNLSNSCYSLCTSIA
jgi:hypothetical protein